MPLKWNRELNENKFQQPAGGIPADRNLDSEAVPGAQDSK